ncbi:hypothetical protein GmHk_18G052463 [Glycine max]|nr:hypothetical protein GmHk_18G052463 [Glycine max]
MSQPYHHQQGYGYNPQFFNASGEDFMSNFMGIDLPTSESTYAYMKSMPIPWFASFHQNEGIVFECPIDPKVITISEDMSLATLGKTIFDANGGYEILIDGFYHQPNYIGDGCVAYDYKEFKHNDDVGKITKGSIELNVTFGRSSDKILAQLRKPRKPRTADDIIALMHDGSV